MRYYVYAYIREDGTAYYIGKGSDNRAYAKHRFVSVPTKDRIKIIEDNLSEYDAFLLEKSLILSFGLKSKGGLLHNRTAGGEGPTGYKHTEETKQRMKNVYFVRPLSDKGRQSIIVSNISNVERKKKISDTLTGRKKTDTHKDRIRQSTLDYYAKNPGNNRGGSKKGHKKPIVTCPYCNKTGSPNNMVRWHFDNCSSFV